MRDLLPPSELIASIIKLTVANNNIKGATMAKIIDTTNISVDITVESEYHVLILRIISVYINQSGRNSWQ